MLTYQDFLHAGDRAKFIGALIDEYIKSEAYRIATLADLYDKRRNKTINEAYRKLYTPSGMAYEDFTATNTRIASNFFAQLNGQRCNYLLGNGVTFNDEGTKAKLGNDFDTDVKHAAYSALIHGVCYLFFNVDRLHLFRLTEFVPLIDEETSALRAGVRFWQLDKDKPMIAVLYEEDGYTRYRKGRKEKAFAVAEEKRAYRLKTKKAPADETAEIVGEENYSALPIVPLYGSRLKQSTLVGMQQSIDSYDLIFSGFANTLEDCADVYWLLENYGGMTDADLTKFRDRIKLQHIAQVDTQSGGKVGAYTQEVPHEGRSAFLTMIRQEIYDSFGALDVKNIAAGSKTATEINAAYQQLDDAADELEFEIIECVRQILALIGVDDTPQFKRNRISNQMEQVEMLNIEAGMVALDDETLLNKFPNFTPEEVQETLERIAEDQASRVSNAPEKPVPPPQEEPEEEEDDVNA